MLACDSPRPILEGNIEKYSEGNSGLNMKSPSGQEFFSFTRIKLQLINFTVHYLVEGTTIYTICFFNILLQTDIQRKNGSLEYHLELNMSVLELEVLVILSPK